MTHAILLAMIAVWAFSGIAQAGGNLFECQIGKKNSYR